MKKFFISAALATLSLVGLAQEPMIVVFPDDSWMDRNQFGKEMNIQGLTQFVCDYSTALRKSDEMKDIITRFGGMFQQHGFQITPLQSALQEAGIEGAIDFSVDLDQSPTDAIINAISPDIRLNLDYKINALGFNKTVDINLFALDPFNNNQIGKISFTSQPTKFLDVKSEVETMMQGDFTNFMDELKSYYTDKHTNGAKLTLKFQTTTTATHKFTDLVDGKPLRSVIIDYVKATAKNGKIGNPRNTTTMVTIPNVRIDLDEMQPYELQDRLVNYLTSIGVPAYSGDLRLGTISILLGSN